MFCPQCGHEILSERIRFCTRCSFPVEAVKALVETGAAGRAEEETRKTYPLRQQDISLGAGLMSIGLIKAVLLSMSFGGGNTEHELLFLTLTLGLIFSAGLLLAQLTPRRRGLTVGATLMFVGALLGVILEYGGAGPPALMVGSAASLLLSLFWVRLSDTFWRIFYGEEPTREPARAVFPHSPAETTQPFLDDGQGTAQSAVPFSVTEDSTSLFDRQ